MSFGPYQLLWGVLSPGNYSGEEPDSEHYWGDTARRDGSPREYAVQHGPWRVWQVSSSEFDCNVAELYGSQFAEPLSAVPSSTFLAEGSPVTVYSGRKIQCLA